jgi:hypothetical protein
VLAVQSLFGVFGVRLYEEPHYDVIDRIGGQVEIRHYASRLAAEVDLAVTGESGRSEAFKLLFARITSAFGNDRIAMTVPVEVSDKERLAVTVPVQAAETSGTPQMRFFLPAKYSLENAPTPLNPRVRLVTTSDEMIPILRFSGSSRDFAEHLTELIARLMGIRHYGLLASGTKTETIARIRELIAAVAPVRSSGRHKRQGREQS